ncbi:ZIP family metal transporter [Sulfolobus acidocaldarius]|uniref:Conserved Crenarchaeal protein n=4 Tax=Sulfolobus acidocaldarius TaxID=2285 RepID=Q4J6Q6_SULAC|nr:hypothetical protein [Sulfolobus acidocaldarius]AAY81525.1 conserved Crenarchaeal protein [Sulfolobus acidocaldarius DSM 639]AGE72128.1 hypothetical protein SacN8_10910 [Sulfolobus acidocaldarius N8]AGE74445.1 hypothetical protein SacRon12I_11155 [Sulfolobus acidocaldarius Ron12/I]ALU29698.1 ZIP family zinc transporter [Sulfolobus acidocaldarius]ALU32433.1 ZIP family zinc transporter [Sulfolobus acidocaldarius]
MIDLAPIALGFLAGGTVAIGSIGITKTNISKTKTAYLSVLAAGILAYIALDTGQAASEVIEGYLDQKQLFLFGVGIVVTSIALLGTWLLLASFDKTRGPAEATHNTPVILAAALGFHNIGEGFAIAAALLGGAVASAITFTIAFGVHNATEGVAIASPGKLVRSKWLNLRNVVVLSLIAGLPTMLGASIYYIGIQNQLFLATLNTIATAALVFPMIRINMIGASMLGGFNVKFWTWFFLGIAIAYGLESLVTLSMS